MDVEEKILLALIERNQNERDPFEEVFEICRKLSGEERRASEAEEELKRVRSELEGLRDVSRESRELQGARLEVQKLQEENSESYRKLYLQEKELEELKDSERRLRLLEEQIGSLRVQLDEERVAKETACQELGQRQADKIKAQQERDELKAENESLVQRLVDASQKAAEKFNEAIRLHEEAASMKLHYEALLKANTTLPMIRTMPGVKERMEYDWHRVPQTPRFRSHAHQEEATAIRYDHGGSMLASCGMDKLVKIWDPFSGKTTHVLEGMLATVTDVDFTADSRHVVAAGNERCLRLYDLASERVRHTLTGHTDKVHACCCSPADAKRCISSGADRMIRIWDLSRGINSGNLVCMSTCFSICMSQEGGMVCSGHFDGGIRAWDLQGGVQAWETKVHQQKVTSVSFMPSGNELLTCSRDNIIHLVDIRMNEVRKSFSNAGFRTATDWCRISCSSDGEHIACGSADKGIYVLNSNTGHAVTVLQGRSCHQYPVVCCEWGPGSLVSADKGGNLIFWQ